MSVLGVSNTALDSLSIAELLHVAETLKSRVDHFERNEIEEEEQKKSNAIKLQQELELKEENEKLRTKISELETHINQIKSENDLNLQNKNKNSSLVSMYERTIRALIQNGKADVNVKIPSFEEEREEGNTENKKEKQLISEDISNTRGALSCLEFALNLEAWSLAALLIEGGADTECPDVHGNTLLHHACRKGDEEKVGFLLRHGADICAVNSRGETSLHVVCSSYSQNELMIKRNGVNSEEKEKERQNQNSSRLNVVRFICNVGRFLINFKNCDGDTALHLCIKKEKQFFTGNLCSQIASLLLS
eukprot:c17130_g1_i1.p1 GENE.c17130_g1_i1~~c17130_g1_i1.p1  ORF type:complete len:306 (+),score=117.89 c17130_g1_i1:24-941(+)